MSKLIPVAEPDLTKKEVEYVTDAVKSGWVSSIGKYIESLETRFAAYCGTKYCAAVSNGTTGLHLALVANGIGPGDEVIVPDFTFIATPNSVRHAGATPVFADVTRDTLTIDPDALTKVITKKTKAMIPVHLYGHPADMRRLREIADRHRLKIIEDAAEAIGAKIEGKRVGGWGNCAVFSLYGNKIITSGEGGMITTDDPQIHQRVRVLRDHCMSTEVKYWHTEVGFNYRMTNLQAALGLAQLERIEEMFVKRDRVFATYSKCLEGVPGIRLNRKASWAQPVFWMLCLEVEALDDNRRKKFMAALKEKGIDSRPYFYPNSDMPMYSKAHTPVTHDVCYKGVNLPSSCNLKKSEIEFICKEVTAILAKLAPGALASAA